MKRWLVVILVLIWGGFGTVAAHDLPISHMRIVPGDAYVHLEVVLNPFELSFASELDTDRNGRLESDELEEHREAITRRLVEMLKIEVAGEPFSAKTAGVVADLSSHHLVLRAHYPVAARGASLSLTSNLAGITSRSHVTRVTYGTADELQRARLDARSNEVTFESAEKKASLLSVVQLPGGIVGWILTATVLLLSAGAAFILSR